MALRLIATMLVCMPLVAVTGASGDGPEDAWAPASLSLSGTGSYAKRGAKEEIKVTQANGLSFSYLEKGQGPLALLLHGYPETAWSWDHLRTRLAESGYRAVAPFMRGYPPTQIPEDSDYTVRALGDDVLALIDALGAETAIIVGHDWGASAVYAAATKSPAKIEKLVALSIPHPKGLSGDPSALLEAPHFLYYQLPTSKWWVSRNNFSHLDRIYKAWAPTFTPSAEDMSNIKDTLGQPGALDAALGYYWSFRKAGEEGAGTATPDSKIDIPSLIISGDQDVIDQARFDTARSAFTGPYEFRLFENVGHFPQLEVPEELAQAILQFLASPPTVDNKPNPPLSYSLAVVVSEPQFESVPEGWIADEFVTRLGSHVPIFREPVPSVVFPLAEVTGASLLHVEEWDGRGPLESTLVRATPGERHRRELEALRSSHPRLSLLVEYGSKKVDLEPMATTWEKGLPAGVFESSDTARRFYKDTDLAFDEVPLDLRSALEWRAFFEQHDQAMAWFAKCDPEIAAGLSGDGFDPGDFVRDVELRYGTIQCSRSPPQLPTAPDRPHACEAGSEDGTTNQGKRDGVWIVSNRNGEQMRLDYYSEGELLRSQWLRSCVPTD